MSGISIYEISEDAKLSILAFQEKKTVEVDITRAILSPEEEQELDSIISCDYIALEVVVKEVEKKVMVISFQNVKADLALIAVDGPDLYRWEKIQVDMLQLKAGKRVHVVKLPIPEGKKFNRRKGVRIDLDIRMEVKQGVMQVPVIVKDLSYCGFKIRELERGYIDPKKPFFLLLTDPYNYGDKVLEQVQALVVRQTVMDNGDVISGCRVGKSHFGALQKYIAVKQLERARGNTKNNSGVTHIESGKEWKSSVAYQLNRAEMKSYFEG